MNRSLAMLLCLFPLFLLGQELPVHNKKVYLSPSGKLYFNKSQPVYFWVSHSPAEDAQKHRLTSETMPQYSNPMYFDTDGRNTLRSPSAVDTVTKKPIEPKMDVHFHIYADGKAPVSKLKANSKKLLNLKGIFYSTDSLTIEFFATDDLCGVEQIMVSVNEKPYAPYSMPIVFVNEEEYRLSYYAVDNTGNVEKIKKAVYVIDKTSPETNSSFEGPVHENILSGLSRINIVATDNIVGVEKIFMSIDSGSFKPYIGKISCSSFSEGQHSIQYYSTDKLGNTSEIRSTVFYIDKTPPQVIDEIIGKTFIANGREFSAGTSKLKLSAFDNKAGVKEIFYSINNGPFEKYDKPIVLSGYKGDLVVKNYAVDNVGNKSTGNMADSRKNKLSFIDLAPPTLHFSFSGPHINTRDTLFISNKTTINFSAKDAESGVQKIEYQIDSGELMVYTKPFVLANEGFYSIAAYAYDNTDNMVSLSLNFVVDTTGPEVFERFSSISLGSLSFDSITMPVYSPNVVIFLSATDEKSGYESLQYSLNGSPYQAYLRDIRGFISDRRNKIKVLAIDKLGNKTESTFDFYVK